MFLSIETCSLTLSYFYCIPFCWESRVFWGGLALCTWRGVLCCWVMAQGGLCGISVHSTLATSGIYQPSLGKAGTVPFRCIGLVPVACSLRSFGSLYKMKDGLFLQGGTHSSRDPGRLSTAASRSFFEGEYGSFRCSLPAIARHNMKMRAPRAADDVPTYKGYPPMTKKPKWWWRTLACLPYLMPLHETWMYAETAYHLHAFLESFEFFTYPFLAVIGNLPGWFLLAYFFGAYLGIVRNNRWPHFFRFHVVTGMLLEIILQVLGTVNEWVPKGLYWGKIGMHYWLAVAFAFLFTVLECMRCALRGMYADVPFISDASYMQIPFD